MKHVAHSGSGRTLVALALGAMVAPMLAGLVGCSTAGYNNGGPSGPPPTTNPNLTGNWQVAVTPTSGGPLFQSLSGFIFEQAGAIGSQQFTTSAFKIQGPTACYYGSATIPSQGYSTGGGGVLEQRSFSVNGQFMVVNATIDPSGATFNGSYVINGGCANSAAGTLIGTSYKSLTGTYSGPVDGTNSAKTISVAVTQYVQGNGDGIFLVTGSGNFTGFPCFSTGTLPDTQGAVSGSFANLAFNTTDPTKAQLVLDGTFNVAADTLTLSSINVTSGSCSGSYGTATLKKQ